MNAAYIVAILLVGLGFGASWFTLEHVNFSSQSILVNTSEEDIELEENPECQSSCDDGDPCTKDWCNSTSNYSCENTKINGTSSKCWGSPTTCKSNSCVSGKCTETTVPRCCGNNLCDSNESCSSCSFDCGTCPLAEPIQNNPITQVTSNEPATSTNTNSTPVNSNTETQNATSGIHTISLNHVIISEIQVGPNEFIELYNPTNTDITAQGWYLSYYSSAKDWNNTQRNWALPNNTIIKKSKFFLINVFNTNDSDWMTMTTDGSPYSQGQISNTGSIALFPFNPKTKTVQGAMDGKIDAIGWGNVSFVFENSSTPLLENGKSVQRKSLDSDSDNNFQDFEITESPSPKNSQNQ